MVSFKSKAIIGGATAFLTLATGVTGWGSRYLGAQDVEEMLSSYGFRALSTGTEDDEQWKKIVEKGAQGGSNGYLSTVLAKSESSNDSKSKIDKLKEECKSLVKTGRWSDSFWDNFDNAKLYCSVSIQK